VSEGSGVRLLVVTAVGAERDAVLAGSTMDGLVVTAGGVGAAAAAATTARSLAMAGPRFDAVLSAGIGGGFPGRVPVGGLAIADRSVAADLGADSPDGFLPLDRLGFGPTTIDADAALLATLRKALDKALPGAIVGPVLTVATVTGTAAGTGAILARHPDAVAEAMEGFGVATAAVQAGVAFGELRAISNAVGPRDREAWRIRDALDALTEAFAALSRTL
jgi:futalosine hydrolase